MPHHRSISQTIKLLVEKNRFQGTIRIWSAKSGRRVEETEKELPLISALSQAGITALNCTHQFLSRKQYNRMKQLKELQLQKN